MARTLRLTRRFHHTGKPSKRAVHDTRKHAQSPKAVGSAAEIKVHFKLPVSFFMVSNVVAHGKCISENSITHTAFTLVHPFCTNSA